MKTIEIKIYNIDEHPAPEKVYQWVRENWHDLNDHGRDEFERSLIKLNERAGCHIDYAISTVPDRGERIRMRIESMAELVRLNPGDCPLTGVCWDIGIIQEAQAAARALDKGCRMIDITHTLKRLHQDTEYRYSDEGLRDYLGANDYHFTEDGVFYE